jgi:hypothetical protein
MGEDIVVTTTTNMLESYFVNVALFAGAYSR